MAALESWAIKDLQENLILKQLANLSLDFSNLQPQAAVDLARSARDTLLAAERVALTRVREAEQNLQVLKDAHETAHVLAMEGEAQMTKVMAAVEDQGIPIAPTPDLTSGLKDPLPLSVRLSECDIPGAHEDTGQVEKEFELEFNEGVGSDTGGSWEADDYDESHNYDSSYSLCTCN